MSYIVNKTDGSVLTEIVDGTIDQTATDLTLIGKNSSNYGEFFNENLVHLLENFASTSAPNNPIQGQLWFDTSENRLKVYDGAGFKVSGGTVVSNTAPSSLAKGDIWIDSTRQQLYFNDGVATILAGPAYTAQQGISGIQVIDVIDSNQINRTIALLYVGQTLLGIFSKDAFTPLSSIAGYTGPIEIGFNVSNYSGVKWHVPVTQADSLLAADDTLKTAESFLSTTDDSATTGTLSILNTTPLILGAGGTSGSAEVKLTNLTFQLNSNVAGQNFQVNMLANNVLKAGIHINATDELVGIYTDVPTATLDVNGDARVRGSLTVEGNLTTVNTTNLEIEDKLIEIGKTDTPSNTTAEGGGISLAGGVDLDKTLLWKSVGSTWESSENFNLAAGKTYKINGLDVITASSLGASINSAPGLISLGNLTSLRVTNLSIGGSGTESTISFVNNLLTDGDITLTPKGAGSVSISNKKIKDLADPVAQTDAVNLQTLDFTVRSAPLAFSLDTTGLTDSTIASSVLSAIFPPAEHENDTICRVHCIEGGTRINKQYSIISGVWTFDFNI